MKRRKLTKESEDLGVATLMAILSDMHARIAELEKKQRQFEADAAYREALGRELLAQRVTH